MFQKLQRLQLWGLESNERRILHAIHYFRFNNYKGIFQKTVQLMKVDHVIHNFYMFKSIHEISMIVTEAKCPTSVYSYHYIIYERILVHYLS